MNDEGTGEQAPPGHAGEPESAGERGESTRAALGKLTEALETVECARGHLYAFHQLCGTADFALGDAAARLRSAGHGELAERIETELVGRNVLHGRWSFQIVEEYDDTYWSPFRELERAAREALAGAQRHTHEAALKRARHTPGHPHHGDSSG